MTGWMNGCYGSSVLSLQINEINLHGYTDLYDTI